jgi:hypothetical protein
VVVVDVAHHVTQRGDGGQLILTTDCERMVRLDLLGQVVKFHGVAAVGYCLMSNHTHVQPRAAVPRRGAAAAGTDKMSLSGVRHECLSSGRTTQARNSRAPAHRDADAPDDDLVYRVPLELELVHVSFPSYLFEQTMSALVNQVLLIPAAAPSTQVVTIASGCPLPKAPKRREERKS